MVTASLVEGLSIVIGSGAWLRVTMSFHDIVFLFISGAKGKLFTVGIVEVDEGFHIINTRWPQTQFRWISLIVHFSVCRMTILKRKSSLLALGTVES